MIIDDVLAALEAAEKAATPGKLTVSADSDADNFWNVCRDGSDDTEFSLWGYEKAQADATLYVVARNALAALIAEMRLLRARGKTHVLCSCAQSVHTGTCLLRSDRKLGQP